MIAKQDDAFTWLSALARSRATTLRPATVPDELEMPIALAGMRVDHKRHIAKLFDRMADCLEQQRPLRDMVAAFDLLVYAPAPCSINGLVQMEDLALRALGAGANERFSVSAGLELLPEPANSRL